MPDELEPGLRGLLESCRAEEADAWEEFSALLDRVARRALAPFGRLGRTEREDVVGGTRERLVQAIRAREIRGTSDGEIMAYMIQALRRRAQDALAAAWIRRRTGSEPPEGRAGHNPERLAVVRQQLAAVRSEMLRWQPADRLLFDLKLYGTSAQLVRDELARRFGEHVDSATVNTRFFRLRARLARALEEDQS